MTLPLDRGERPTLFGVLGYHAIKIVANAAFKVLFRLRVYGLDNVPSQGPLIVAPNHASFLDSILVGSQFPRTLYFMGKNELFRIPVFGWLMRQFNGFPIRRDEGDVGAIKKAERILKSGNALIVFPEGHRQPEGRFAAPKAGVGMLSSRTGAAVLPVYVHNSHRLLHGSRLTIVFGKPLSMIPGESYTSFSNQVMETVRNLRESHFLFDE